MRMCSRLQWKRGGLEHKRIEAKTERKKGRYEMGAVFFFQYICRCIFVINDCIKDSGEELFTMNLSTNFN